VTPAHEADPGCDSDEACDDLCCPQGCCTGCDPMCCCWTACCDGEGCCMCCLGGYCCDACCLQLCPTGCCDCCDGGPILLAVVIGPGTPPVALDDHRTNSGSSARPRPPRPRPGGKA
jgi:hypothetical protein